MSREERIAILERTLKVATDQELAVIFYLIRTLMHVHHSQEALGDLATDLQVKP